MSSTDASARGASSVDGTASSPDPAASSADAGDASSSEAASGEDTLVGPPDATPLLHRARVLYPTAKRFTVEGTVFVLAAMDSCPQFDAVAREVRRALRAYSEGRFGTMPVEPVYVLLFASHDRFVDYAANHWGAHGAKNLGGYLRDTREIGVDLSQGSGTVLHEIVHPITEQDWPGIPAWFDECVASVFEQPRWEERGHGLHGAKDGRRWQLLKTALRTPADKPRAHLDRLFGMSDLELRGIPPDADPLETLRDTSLLGAALERQKFNYAVARYTCLWADDLDPPRLFAWYQAWRDSFAADPTGRATFERVFGAPPSAFQERWAAWVQTPGDSAR